MHLNNTQRYHGKVLTSLGVGGGQFTDSRTYSTFSPSVLYISGWDILFKYQDNLSLMISSFILITCMFDHERGIACITGNCLAKHKVQDIKHKVRACSGKRENNIFRSLITYFTVNI